MDEDTQQSTKREHLLIELKSIIKQVFHEAVNHELSQDNINYITQSLFKRLEETLVFGLKNQQNGFWKILQKVLHPDTLTQLNNVPGMNQSSLWKERTWIALALKEDSFVSYINCFVFEKNIPKFYDDWSIVRHNDSCNAFLSLLSGLENVSFNYELADARSWPTNIKLSPRILSGNKVPWSPASSLTDSGVQLDRSEDYLNGNLPSNSVVLRRKPKDTQRHVSFHEDSLAKSPSGRKLRWDDENSRYSWAGEELDALKLPGLGNIRMGMERGAPEGEESPASRTEVGRVRPRVTPAPTNKSLASIKHSRRLKGRKSSVDWEYLSRFTLQIDNEVNNFRRPKSMYEVELPEKLIAMLGLRGIKVYAYKMWGKVVILTCDKLIILNGDLRTTVLTLPQIQQVVVFPLAHEMHLLTRKQTHILRCGDRNLTHEVLTRLAFNLHRAGLPPVHFRLLHPDDMTHLKQELINRKVLTEDSVISYLGLVRLQASEDKYATSEAFEKQGCLMFCTGRGQTWQPANCVLRGGVLNLYSENRSPIAEINLATSCSGCERSMFSDRPHTFTLSLNQSPDFNNSKNGFYQDLALRAEPTSSSKTSQWAESALNRLTNGRPASEAFGQWLTGILRPTTPSTTIHFAAADEYETSDWLQAFLMVFCHKTDDNQWETVAETSEASLLVTEDTAVLFTHTPQSQCSFRIMASALIHHISAFNVGSHPHDSYCIIELECMEAGSETSDWVLHFGSRFELEQSLAALESQWRLDETFPYKSVEDARCERTQDCLAREWFA